jgi:hypothetical protein
MPGNFTTKLLSEDSLPYPPAAIYTAPPNTSTIIKSIVLVNTYAFPVSVSLYIRNGVDGDNRHIIPESLLLAPNYVVETDLVYTLGAGDSVVGYASVQGVVDYTIHGVEES